MKLEPGEHDKIHLLVDRIDYLIKEIEKLHRDAMKLRSSCPFCDQRREHENMH